MAASRAGAKLSAGQEEMGATLSGASISCRVNFNLQLFCDRRFCQHESPKLFLFSLAPFYFLFVLFLGILQRYMYVLRIFLLVLSFFFFGYLACWSTDISDSAAGRLGAARLPLVLMTARRAEQTNGPGLIAAAAARLELYASLAATSPHLFSLGRKLY